MTVKYAVLHCDTLHYIVQHTVAHCSSANKTRSNKVVGMQSGYCSQEHTSAERCC